MFKNNYGVYENFYDSYGNKKYFSTLEDLKNYLNKDLTITFVNNFMSRENGFFKFKILKGDIVIDTLEVIK
jgi:hypothetical protein